MRRESRRDVVEQVQEIHGQDHVERLQLELGIVDRARSEMHVADDFGARFRPGNGDHFLRIVGGQDLARARGELQRGRTGPATDFEHADIAQ